jgi:glucose/arabinose dehydrogenase
MPRRRLAAVLTIGFLLLSCAPSARDVSALTTIRVASGLQLPVFVTAPRTDSRLFIVEQRGVVRIWRPGGLVTQPFLDIDSIVVNISGNDERGLLGLAFHPEYPDSPFAYVNFVDNIQRTRIARYRLSNDPNRLDRNSKHILLTIAQPFANHNGGNLAFGPDGYLYIGMGDGGSGGDPGNRAQSDTTLLGKMLRIDVDHPAMGLPYGIPPGNPFGAPGDGKRDEIWSKGWRNPYRWSFDRTTGDLWAADVGQEMWEEVDFEPAGTGGRNYGWKIKEGYDCYNSPETCDSTGLTRPIHVYSHGEGCSITGGFVYRGAAMPSLAGTYFFADFCSATIWSLRYDGATVTELTDRTGDLAPGGGLSIRNISGFGEDGFGELYLVDRGSGTNGEVYKITVAGVDSPASGVRTGLRIGPPAPNPFVATTRVLVTLPRAGSLDLSVVDVAGRAVAALASGERDAGDHAFSWDGLTRDGRRAAAGSYWIRAALDGDVTTRSVTVLD